MSQGPPPPKPAGLRGELRTVRERGGQVWRLVSPQRRRTFLFGGVLMFLASAATTAVQLWLGGLVNAMQGNESPNSLANLPLYVSGLQDDFDWREVTSTSGEVQAAAPGAASAAIPGPQLLKQIAIAYLIAIALVHVIAEALQVTRKCLIENTCTRIEKETTVNLVTHLLRVDLSRLSAERVGALHGRIHRSVEGFIKFLKLAFMDFSPALFSAGMALLVALYTQPWIALVMAAVIPASLFITVRQIMSQKGIRVELLRKREGLDGTVVEQLSGLEYIRAANTLPIELQRVEHVAEERRSMEIRHHVAMAVFDAIKKLNEGVFFIAMIAGSIFLALEGRIFTGDILTFSLLYLQVIMPLREVHRILDDAHESSIRVGDLLQMMHEPLDDSYGSRTARAPRLDDECPVILVDHLGMNYRMLDGRMKRALDDVSLQIRRGETIGAAGPSGSGKSTWLKIVMRLVHSTEGVVLLGGEPIQAISREDIGRLIGYVSQTPFVFAGTVAENIAYGSAGASQADIERAARLAYIHDEILAMPNGYQTLLAERGQNLSGGQRQRIALARIFLKDQPILILDEATSALDNISEKKIQQAIADTRSDRTVIMVAHRLSTLREADRILVFDQGRIVETGNYDELLARGGVFTQLVRSAEGHP